MRFFFRKYRFYFLVATFFILAIPSVSKADFNQNFYGLIKNLADQFSSKQETKQGSTSILDPRDPDIAYDTINNRYLMVWEEEISPGNFQIFGRFRNPDGTPLGNEDIRLTPERPTQGCFYPNFDIDNSGVTTPTDCINHNASVAYNNGQYLIAWEVSGTAQAPSSNPDNHFSGIFVRILDANTLNPISGFEEGLLISQVQIAPNKLETTCGDKKHACNDSQVMAWGQAINPDVAPKTIGNGFVITWQSNKDYIGCSDPQRRQAWAIYGRYIDQTFADETIKPSPIFSVFKDDSTANSSTCEPLANVDVGLNPRIAYNQVSKDFVIAYQVQRGNGGNSSIGAKRVTLNDSNIAEVKGNFMPDLVMFISGQSLETPDIVSWGDHYIVAASNGIDIFAKAFSSTLITPTIPLMLNLGGDNKTTPRLATNLGIDGTRPNGSNQDPERLAVSFEQNEDIWVSMLNENLEVTRLPANISAGTATKNRQPELASDFHNFVISWHGQDEGDKVFATFVESKDIVNNNSPLAPELLTPEDGVTFPPTRLYISWNPSSDPEDGNNVTYNLYFGENNIPASPQVKGIKETHFVIGPETESVTGITLKPNKTYQWKVETVDSLGATTSSAVRTFNTDDSVVAWWRFDNDPLGPVCPSGDAGETICDFSGKNNHGIAMGGPTYIAPGMPDVLLGALEFDGVDDWVEVADASDLNFPNGSSIGIEVRLNSDMIIDPGFWIFGKGASGAHGNYSLVLLTTNKLYFTYSESSASLLPTYQSNIAINAGEWVHMIMSYQFGSASSLDMRINGNTVNGIWSNSDGMPTATGNEPPLTNSLPLSIGRRTTLSQNYFDGNIDELIIYNKQLSDEFKQNTYATTP